VCVVNELTLVTQVLVVGTNVALAKLSLAGACEKEITGIKKNKQLISFFMIVDFTSCERFFLAARYLSFIKNSKCLCLIYYSKSPK
jgi:hypothetical protein